MYAFIMKQQVLYDEKGEKVTNAEDRRLLLFFCVAVLL
jgi:hypothetical protein